MNKVAHISFPGFKLLEDQQNIQDSLYSILNQKEYINTFELLSYGSASHGLFINNYSDFNLCIIWKDVSLSYDKVVEYTVNRLKENNKYCKIKIVNIPQQSKIIECFDMNNNKIHIAFNDLKRIASSHFIEAYISIDSRLKQLCFIIKKWAKHRKISLSSYCLILMIIYFLQVKQILPELSVRIFDMQNNVSKWSENDYQINLQLYKDFAANNSESLYVLLKEFFQFYGHKFNYHTSVVTVQQSNLCLTKLEIQCISNATVILPLDIALIRGYVMQYISIPIDILNVIILFYHQHCTHWLCVQDPFDSKINVTAYINEENLYSIQKELKSTFRILSQVNNCNGSDKLNYKLNVIM
eukprot:445610_1